MATPSSSSGTKRGADESKEKNGKRTKQAEVRLPSSVVPRHYHVSLSVAVLPTAKQDEEFVFHGHTEIELDVHQATEQVVCHALELKFTAADVALDGTPATSVEFDTESQTVTMKFGSSIPVGKHSLTVKYTGHLNDKLCGFYRSKYKDTQGTQKHMAVTQFEATDARRSLPCWDEPALKAVFTVRLIVPKGNHMQAVSNMRVVKQRPLEAQDSLLFNSDAAVQGDLEVFEYAPSPKMSTYLLAFIVGEFEFIEEQLPDKSVTVRIYTPVGKTEQGKFALHVSVKALEFYNQYFGLPFPLDKVDLLAIPDFAAGAMENWGAITYRETRLLIDGMSSVASKTAAARTICHELAHMWFGNLVTMEWWTSLWLNEGFARFMEFLAVDHVFPEWRIWVQYVDAVYCSALSLDALSTSHAVEVEVHHPDEINEIFDRISYAKGSAVIRMLHAHMGPKLFQEGLQKYLKRHAYGNAVTNDLWVAMNEAYQASPESKDQVDIATLMNGWITQVGYPVLFVEQKDKDTVTVRQKKFYAQASQASAAASSDACVRWNVPLSYTTYSDDGKVVATGRTIVSAAAEEVNLNVAVPPGGCVKFNTDQQNYCRVAYSDSLLKGLMKSLRQSAGSATGGLSEIDRIGISDDIYAIAKSGTLSMRTALDVFACYAKESSAAVLSALASCLFSLLKIHANQDYTPKLHAFVKSLYSPVLERIGWQPSSNEDAIVSKFRSTLISLLGRVQDKATLNKAGTMFMSARSKLSNDILSAVYRISVKHDTHGGHTNVQAWQTLLQQYANVESTTERVRIMNALGSTPDAQLLMRTLEWGMSDAVRLQDKVYVFSGCCSSAQNRKLTWAFMKQRWSQLEELFMQGTGFLMSRIVSAVVSGFMEEAMAKDVEKFFAEHPCPPAARTLKQALETVRGNVARLAREKDQLQEWSQNVTSTE